MTCVIHLTLHFGGNQPLVKTILGSITSSKKPYCDNKASLAINGFFKKTTYVFENIVGFSVKLIVILNSISHQSRVAQLPLEWIYLHKK